MKNSSEFKQRLPFRHISIRVPWHDNGWDGSVCKNPKANAACLVLDRIRDSRNDNQEGNNAGKLIKKLFIKSAILPKLYLPKKNWINF